MKHGRKDPKEEALGLLQEECAEVIQQASKIFRSGPDFRPNQGTLSGLTLLHREIADVLIMISLCEAVGAVKMGRFDFQAYLDEKKEKMKLFTSIPHDIIEGLS